jgi:hypothetical protein
MEKFNMYASLFCLAMFTKQIIVFAWITIDGGKVPWYSWTISGLMCGMWFYLSWKRIKKYKESKDGEI